MKRKERDDLTRMLDKNRHSHILKPTIDSSKKRKSKIEESYLLYSYYSWVYEHELSKRNSLLVERYISSASYTNRKTFNQPIQLDISSNVNQRTDDQPTQSSTTDTGHVLIQSSLVSDDDNCRIQSCISVSVGGNLNQKGHSNTASDNVYQSIQLCATDGFIHQPIQSTAVDPNINEEVYLSTVNSSIGERDQSSTFFVGNQCKQNSSMSVVNDKCVVIIPSDDEDDECNHQPNEIDHSNISENITSFHGNINENISPKIVHGNINENIQPRIVHGNINKNIPPRTVHGNINENIQPRIVQNNINENVPPRIVHSNINENIPPNIFHGNVSENVPPTIVYGNINKNIPQRIVHGNIKENVPPRIVHGNINENTPPRTVHGNIDENIQPRTVHGNINENIPPRIVHGNINENIQPRIVQNNINENVLPRIVHSNINENIPPNMFHGNVSENVPPTIVYGNINKNIPKRIVHGNIKRNVPPTIVHGNIKENVPPTIVHDNVNEIISQRIVHGYINESIPPRIVHGNINENVPPRTVHGNVNENIPPNHLRLFQCDRCHKTFHTNNDLKAHETIVHFNHLHRPIYSQSMSHRCQICGHVFPSKESLQFHILQFPTTHTLQEVINSSVETEFTCKYCGKQCFNEFLLKEHEFLNHFDEVQPKFTCKHCSKLFCDKTLLKEHLLSHVDGLQCTICQVRFQRMSDFATHMLGHSVVSSQVRNPINDNVDQVPSSVQQTFQTSNRSLQQQYTCKDCDETFADEIMLNEHLPSHSDDLLHMCTICRKSFERMNDLKAHMLTHSGEIPRRIDQAPSKDQKTVQASNNSVQTQFTCPCCYKRFVHQALFKEHFISHHGDIFDIYLTHMLNRQGCLVETEFTCKYCGKQCFDEFLLKEHEFLNHFDEVQPQLQFTCKHCSKQFSDKTLLKEHLLSHVDSLQCTICQVRFQRMNDFATHMLGHYVVSSQIGYPNNSNVDQVPPSVQQTFQTSYRSLQQQYTCKDCDETFADEIMLNEHLPSHSDDLLHMCTICRKSFERMNDLKAHMLTHSGEIPRRIDQAPSKDQNTVLASNNSVQTQYTCEDCGETFVDEALINEHLLSHSDNQQCSICQETFMKGSDFQTHMLSHQDRTVNSIDQVLSEYRHTFQLPNYPDGTQFICHYCDKRFIDESLLKDHLFDIHLLSHFGENPNNMNPTLPEDEHTVQTSDQSVRTQYTCKYCNKSFIDKSLFREHFVSHYDDILRCTKCQISYKKVSNLLTHMLTHQGESPDKINQIAFEDRNTVQTSNNSVKTQYTCKDCDRKFTDETLLSEHISHSDDLLHICSICQESFERMNDLKTHMLTHQGEIPHRIDQAPSEVQNTVQASNNSVQTQYTCKDCGETFLDETLLNEHLLSHAVNQQCSICQETFRRVIDLDTHMLTHQGEKPNKTNQGLSDGRHTFQHPIQLLDETQFICHYCDKQFVEEKLLKDHLFNIHLPNESSYLLHSYNSWVYESELSKQNSLLVEKYISSASFTKLKTFDPEIQPSRSSNANQEICGGKVYQPNQLSTKKCDENAFKCSICGKGYKTKISLNNHLIWKHSEERPFSCHLCDKSFKYDRVLKRHLFETHTDERPFKCEICGQCFSRKYNMEQHMQVHEKGGKTRGERSKKKVGRKRRWQGSSSSESEGGDEYDWDNMDSVEDEGDICDVICIDADDEDIDDDNDHDNNDTNDDNSSDGNDKDFDDDNNNDSDSDDNDDDNTNNDNSNEDNEKDFDHDNGDADDNDVNKNNSDDHDNDYKQ